MTAALKQVAADVSVMTVAEFWNRDYRAYARYTVSDRAVPHADSGLKPVAQRILYAASVTGATPTGDAPKTQKLASVVSGDYHPHGDASVAETIALMAGHYQRAKLIDGKGAFPASVGDTPASPRYTHARLSAPGFELVRDLRDGPVVDMVPTYDNEHVEPVTLPSRFPALLVYGCPGGSMAVGWASTIPAHNPRDVIAAARALLADPNLSDDALCELMVGPDWGSGGTVVGTEGIRDYILTGRGKMTVSGKVEVSGKEITITELPPGVAAYTPASGKKPPGGILGALRTAVLDGRITGVSDAAELTGRANGVCLSITCKRGVDPHDVVRQLREKTPFETTFAAQLVALDANRVPRVWTVRELLERFLHLRDSVVLRRSRHRHEKAAARQHLVRGMLAVTADIDAAVRIIRDSDTVDIARAGLCERFEVDTDQADHVLALQLRKLTRMDTLELAREDESLTKDLAALERLISSASARRKAVDAELAETAKVFAGTEYDRRTVIDADAVPASVTRKAAEESDGGGPRAVNPGWKLDDRGMFSANVGSPLSGGLGWAVWCDGRVKLTDGKGLPSKLRDVPVAPDTSGLLCSGVLPPGAHLLLVTKAGKALRLDPSTINPQGAAGNGVAGVKLADEDDSVLAAFAVTDATTVLAISDKAFKVAAVADIPVKGRGSQGVGFYPFVKGEDSGLSEAHASDTGFVVGGKARPGTKRAAPSIKAPSAGWARG